MITQYLFNVEFETLSYIYSMFTRKKLCFFNVDLKSISIYTLYFQEKSHVFSMWDKKTF